MAAGLPHTQHYTPLNTAHAIRVRHPLSTPRTPPLPRATTARGSLSDAAKLGEAVRRLREVSERSPLIDGNLGSTIDRDSPFLRGEMVLRDVTFSYPSRSEQDVLAGCSLTLKAGKVTALRAFGSVNLLHLCSRAC